jgi:integrase
VSQRVATDLVGHSDIRTTARYYQAVDDAMADDAIRRLPLVKSKTA